jgi:phosphopantothenoylcysteine decarboxylase/phosphopantothenate--cysteine ligase
MLRAVEAALPADVAIMAAAVADWRAEREAARKIKKDEGGRVEPLRLVENPDILATIAHLKTNRPSLVIGFAAETDDLIANAQKKLKRKGADWILANDVSPGAGVMGGERNTIHFLSASGIEEWPTMGKPAVAERLLDRIASALDAKDRV